jgi:hypothetical protein
MPFDAGRRTKAKNTLRGFVGKGQFALVGIDRDIAVGFIAVSRIVTLGLNDVDMPISVDVQRDGENAVVGGLHMAVRRGRHFKIASTVVLQNVVEPPLIPRARRQPKFGETIIVKVCQERGRTQPRLPGLADELRHPTGVFGETPGTVVDEKVGAPLRSIAAIHANPDIDISIAVDVTGAEGVCR